MYEEYILPENLMHETKSRTRDDRIVHRRTLRECRDRNEFQAQIECKIKESHINCDIDSLNIIAINY